VLCHASTAVRADFTFAAYGDTPYTEDEASRHIGMIAEMNREPLAFVVHIGDFKNSWSPCTDALFMQRRDEFALFHHALIYTPGDNEWSDCWRAPYMAGATRDPLERLQKLRSLFFADNYSLGQQKIALARQNAGYPENARWEHQGILFVALNVPGDNNNLRMPEEFAARDKAVLIWLESAFSLARAQRHRALVVAMQANPFLRSAKDKNGYAGVLDALRRETVNFDGEVLLIHGDTHHYRFDQPLAHPRTRKLLRNFTRLEVFGYPFSNWVRVKVAQRDGRVTFAVSPGGP
jgi:hypothetical protein